DGSVWGSSVGRVLAGMVSGSGVKRLENGACIFGSKHCALDSVLKRTTGQWVSPIHCVPKKGGIIVVADENNGLIPMRLLTGWRVCIDYRKLNDATRKDHFPLPFMDQMLERICITCIYGDGKPVTCSVCEGMLRGGCCLPCDLKAKKLFIRDPNAYSFNNSNHLPQPQYENYLCNLCGNNSQDGYDCQQQFLLVSKQESSYNQNYNDNYYPHDSPSFSCCDNCGESHATFQCQSMDQNIDFFGSDQIQNPQYPEIHPPSQEISDEVFQAKEDLVKSIQTFLEEFNYITFGEKPKILLQAWDKFFAIQYAQLEDSNELFQKLLEDLRIINKELTECNHPTLFEDNEDHYVQNKENLENSSNSNQEKEGPPQDSDIHEIIKSGVEELVQILNECEVTSEDKRECDVPVCENSPICDDHSEIFFDSNNDDDISSNDDAFEDIEYVEASLPDPEIVSVEEENVVYHEEEEFDLEEIQDVVLREKLLSINRLIANIESLNDNP
nr:reverse transcriptase domain-containing protein [Tanacetum cinerariifolium]